MEETPPWCVGNQGNRVKVIREQGYSVAGSLDTGCGGGAVEASGSVRFVRDTVVETAKTGAINENAGVVVLEGEGHALLNVCQQGHNFGRKCGDNADERWAYLTSVWLIYISAADVAEIPKSRKIGTPFYNGQLKGGNNPLDVTPGSIDSVGTIQAGENTGSDFIQLGVF